MPRSTLTPRFGHVGELDRVVLARPDRLGEVFADLLGVDVEGGDELDVADVVAAEVDVHQARNFVGRVGVLVVLDALDEGVGAVADADDRDADLLVRAADAVRAWPFAPLLSLMKFEVLLDRAGWLKTPGGLAGYSSSASPPSSLTPETSPESSFRTCHTRWKTVKIVRAAIT